MNWLRQHKTIHCKLRLSKNGGTGDQREYLNAHVLTSMGISVGSQAQPVASRTGTSPVPTECTPIKRDLVLQHKRSIMLQLINVNTFYDPSHVLQNLSLEVKQGEIVCLLGANAAGKTTTMKTIFGWVRSRSGSILFKDQPIERKPTGAIVASGLTLVPEGRRVFPRMSVLENLEMGAYTRHNRAEIQSDIERVCEIFPRLKERLKQSVGTMSGGEQQMLAMARALMSRPTMICLDEPSMGLSPILVETVFSTIASIRDQGTTVLLVEQNAAMALSLADRGYVLQTGRIVLSDDAHNLLTNDLVRQAYLGG
jgi:branched-chain amino acid transport system ATP-binding protein